MLREPFRTLREPGAARALMSFAEDGPFIDLFDLAPRLTQDEAFGVGVRDAADELLGTVDPFVVASFGMSGYADFPSSCRSANAWATHAHVGRPDS